MSLDVPALAKPVKLFTSVDAQPMQELAGKETVARDFFRNTGRISCVHI